MRSVPYQVGGLGGITAIAAGGGDNVALRNDGTVWTWGFNDWGSLGDGTRNPLRKVPAQVVGLNNGVRIATKKNHSAAVRSDGSLWVWGSNFAGQLGDGTSTDRYVAQPVPGAPPVRDIDTGWYHTIVAKPDGTVSSWGDGIGFPHYDQDAPRRVLGETGIAYLNLGSPPAPLGGVVAVSPSRLKFATRLIGTQSTPQQLIVTNSGSTSQTYDTVRLSGAQTSSFIVRGDSCSRRTVGPGAVCSLDVVFAPQAAGEATALITISAGAGASVVEVSGTGAEASTFPLPEQTPPAEGTLRIHPSTPFDAGKPTVILTHGLQTYGFSKPQADELWTGFAQREAGDLLYTRTAGAVNILQYVWDDAMQPDFAPTGKAYLAAREKVHAAGEGLATKLGELFPSSASYAQPIHFIGHSLGTAVNAYAARRFFETRTTRRSQFTILDFPSRVAEIPGLNAEDEQRFGFDANFFGVLLGPVQGQANLRIENYFAPEPTEGGVGAPVNGDAYNHAGFQNPYWLGDLFPGEGVDNDHSGVQQWYRWTIDPNRSDFLDSERAAMNRLGAGISWTWSPNGFFCQPDGSFTPPRVGSAQYRTNVSLDPCAKGWSWAPSVAPEALPPDNASSVVATSSAVSLDASIDRGCTIKSNAAGASELDCPPVVAIAAATKARRAKATSDVIAMADIVGAVAQIIIPVEAEYLSMQIQFSTPSRGDFATITIDDVPVWSVLATDFPVGVVRDSGPIPIRGLAGSRTFAFALHRVHGSNGSLRMADFRFVGTGLPIPGGRFGLAVAKTGTSGGTVTGAGIDCGSDCTESYESGSLVTLSAIPAAGSTFAGWSGACSGTGTCTVTMTAAKSVVAMFNATATLAGTNGNDTLTGTAAGDVIAGLGGDDRITGLGGNDAIDGGSGVDTAVYVASSANYQVEKSGTTWKVTDNTGVDGQDTLRHVERLEFADKTFELTNLPRTAVPAYGRTQDFLFDAVFYLLDNPELVPTLSRATATQHYLTTGATEGRWPNAWFDATYYKNRWSDLTPLNLDHATLFLHYNLYGVWEGRSAGAVFHQFDGNRYLRDNPDVAAYVDAYLADFLGSRTNGAIAHYVIYGQHELRPAFNVSGQPIELGYVANLGQ